MEMQAITIRFPADEAEKFRQIAADKNVSVSDVVRDLIRENQGEILTENDQIIRLECQVSDIQNLISQFSAETNSQIKNLSESLTNLVNILQRQEEQQKPKTSARFLMATLIMTRAVMEMTINQSDQHRETYAPLIEKYKALAKDEIPAQKKG